MKCCSIDLKHYWFIKFIVTQHTDLELLKDMVDNIYITVIDFVQSKQLWYQAIKTNGKIHLNLNCTLTSRPTVINRKDDRIQSGKIINGNWSQWHKNNRVLKIMAHKRLKATWKGGDATQPTIITFIQPWGHTCQISNSSQKSYFRKAIKILFTLGGKKKPFPSQVNNDSWY